MLHSLTGRFGPFFFFSYPQRVDSQTLPDVHRLIRRLNWALLRQGVLARREDELRRDNHRLRLLLRRRLDGAAIGGGPALLAVKAAPTADGPALAPTRHNVIEAGGVVVRNSLS